ncbi:MAG: TIGR02281 family clan AA aspartic protease [Methylococcaceae bacterium]|nr:TIGR02281 family clan AA aspartic protease [Methylococcaceae bacterium]
MYKQTLTLFILFALTMLSHAACADKIYKCKNAKGILIYSSAPCAENVETLNTWTVTTKVKVPEILTIRQNDLGQYLLNGAVNDKAVAFVVDTGATQVSLPVAVAETAQISCQNQVTIHTANGASKACSVTIAKFKFGPFVLHNVAAIIAPNLDQPLLGMNVLQQFKIAQEQGEMHISQRH